MAYKFSERLEQDKISAIKNDPNGVDLGKVATVFIIFGLFGLLTSWLYNIDTQKVAKSTFIPYGDGIASHEVGPINVKKYNEVYNIKIEATMDVQTWSFIEGQVLNSDDEFLFSFGKELWHEQGRDSDGTWREADDNYSINVTFPQPGKYYLQFSTESNREPYGILVEVTKKYGSSLPHLWFGIIAIFIGVILNEKRNRTIRNVLNNFES